MEITGHAPMTVPVRNSWAPCCLATTAFGSGLLEAMSRHAHNGIWHGDAECRIPMPHPCCQATLQRLSRSQRAAASSYGHPSLIGMY